MRERFCACARERIFEMNYLTPFDPERERALKLDLVLSGPLGRVGHVLLDLVDTSQSGQGLVQQEGRVVHHHVDEPDKLLPVIRLADDRHLQSKE